MTTADVLVVGAGPTGLTLACGLAARGVRIRVVDKADGPASTSRANILHARGAEVLARLGVLGAIEAQSLAPIGMRMHVDGRPIATMRFAPDPQERFQAVFVSQALIEGELRRRLGEYGVTVEWRTEVTALEQDLDGVTAWLGEEQHRFGWVVGCDGAHSAVRKHAGIAFPGVEVVEQFLLADVEAEWDRDRRISSGWFHADGLVLAVPMNDAEGTGRLWRLMADVPASKERLGEQQIMEVFRRLLAERAGQADVAIRRTVWTSVFRVQRRLAEDYRSGRVLLAGDAAHIHSPIGGQGMNTGIGDAENLAWKLGLVVAGPADARLLDSYSPERRPLAEEVLRTTTTNTVILVGQLPVTRFIRDRVLVPLLRSGVVQRAATRKASQLWVSYRRGPLGGRGRSPRPGDRVGDRATRRPDGTDIRLYDELGDGWVVLAPTAAQADDLHAVALERLGSQVHPQIDSTIRDGRLIRPDGHLGWRGDDPKGYGRGSTTPWQVRRQAARASAVARPCLRRRTFHGPRPIDRS